MMLKTIKKNKSLIFILVFALIGSVVLLRLNAAPATTFKHPGILLSQNRLDFIKDKVNSNQEPWKSAYDQLASTSASNYTYTASPVTELKCSTSLGINEGFEQAGCSEFNANSAAVYTQSLRFIVTGDDRYAQSAIDIMNQWADTLTYIPYDFPGDPDLSNGWPAYWQNKLLVGWSAESMLRGAEILRYNYSGWDQSDIDKFETMLRNLYLPVLMSDRTGNGNGGVTWAEAVTNIGIFLDDSAIYEEGINMWRHRSSAMVYLDRDGSQPAYPKDLETGKNTYGTPDYIRQLWRMQSGESFIDGQEQETCRDMGHTMMGFGAMANTAETARIQGLDLYNDPEYKDRFIKGLELNTDYINQMLDRMNSTGQSMSQVGDSNWIPSGWPNCNDFKDGGSSAYLGAEIAYNHYANRMGESLPNTKKLIERVRPQKSYGNHMLWETLTHAESGSLNDTSIVQERFPGDPNPRVTGKSYWGAAIHGNGDPARHEDPTGKSLSVRRTYWDMRTTGKIDKSVNSAKDDINNNRLPFISYKLKHSWVDTTNGADEAAIDDLLRRLDNLGGPVWLTIHHEPEGSASTNWADESSGPSGWINMQKYIRSRMDAVNTKNIAFVANLMTWTWDSRSGRNPDDWWVDNVWDIYTANVYCDHDKHCGDGKDRVIDQDMWKAYEAFAESKNIPYGIGEWGDRGETTAAGQDIQDTWDYLFENNKDIVAWTYFDSNLNSPTGGWELKGEALNSFQDILKNDSRVMRIDELGSGTTKASNYGTLTENVDVPVNGTYKIWVRMSAPDNSNNSVQVQVDNGESIKIGDKSIEANKWTWVDYKDGNVNNKAVSTLSSGSHEVTLTGIEKGVKIDRVLITDESCVPVDDGENCANPSPSDPPPPPSNADISITSPKSNDQLKGVVKVSTGPAAGIKEVSFRLNGKWQSTDKSAPFEWDWDSTKVQDGTHELTIRARKIGDPGNVYTEKSIKVNVANKPTLPPEPEPEPVDSQKPTKPSNLRASLRLDWSQFKYIMDLNWQASLDNVEVKDYQVSRNNQVLGDTQKASFSDSTNLKNKTTYKYSVVAKDEAGNVSEPSEITVEGNCVFIWCSLEVK